MARPKTVNANQDLNIRVSDDLSAKLVLLAENYTKGNRSILVRNLIDQLYQETFAA